MKADKYREKINSFEKQERGLQKKIDAIDAKKLTLVYNHLYKTKIGRASCRERV